MKNLSEKLSKTSGYLQSLNTPKFVPQVEKAVKKRDKNALIEVCREAKIPAKDLAMVVSTLFNMSDQPKYPNYM